MSNRTRNLVVGTVALVVLACFVVGVLGAGGYFVYPKARDAFTLWQNGSGEAEAEAEAENETADVEPATAMSLAEEDAAVPSARIIGQGRGSDGGYPGPATTPVVTGPIATATPTVTVTAAPVVTPTATVVPEEERVTSANLPEAVTYEYTPGGTGYALGVNLITQTYTVPVGIRAYTVTDTLRVQEEIQWTRIVRAMNEEYLPWTFLFALECDQPVEEVAQWDSATKLKLAAPETADLHCVAYIRRDLYASANHAELDIEEDPYITANAKNSPEGLGWFLEGNGWVSVFDSEQVELGLRTPDLSVAQLAFPKNWDGYWEIHIVVPAGGLVTLAQGERLTNVDTFNLPE